MNSTLPSPSLQVYPLKTQLFTKDLDLTDFLIQNIPASLVKEEMILVITSKIVSIAEDQIVQKQSTPGTEEEYLEKKALVKKEADQFLAETIYRVSLTVKHGILIPTAGIDESNSIDSNYILFPKNPYHSAEQIYFALKRHFKLNRLGIIISDSHTTPLRKGVTGIGLSHFGFKATRDLVGQPDLFGREMKMTHVNILDGLSTAAVLMMGESNDSCPLALVYSTGVHFQESGALKEIQIPLEEDLYGTFFTR